MVCITFLKMQMSSCMHNGPKTKCSKWKHQCDHQKPRSSYCLLTRPVCKYAFLFLLGISQDQLTRLHKHYQAEGLTLSRRKTGGRKNNTRSLTLDDTARVVRFIKNYSEDHAVFLLGRAPVSRWRTSVCCLHHFQRAVFIGCMLNMRPQMATDRLESPPSASCGVSCAPSLFWPDR